jgi:hypothetical protein
MATVKKTGTTRKSTSNTTTTATPTGSNGQTQSQSAGNGRGNGNLPANFEELVRQRAYEIYVASGRPHGRAEDHWRQAEQEIRSRYAR